MKNLKKLMSVVLSVVMLMSFVVSTSAATFTDVAETDKAYEAIEVLAALKILEGKEAGAFDPEANIKRSEFAAVVCRAMNQESAAIGVANFTDVSADHWAAGYIGWAAAQGIVNGRGDGSFDPDANVSYNEAIAMIVRAMGYEWYVEEMLGGYPTGYARIAGSYKIDKDIASANGNAPATRADVATLVYNAFDAPLMDMSYTISADAEYVIYNGSKNVDGEKRTLLSYYADTYKVKATVDKTYRNAAANETYIDGKGNKLMDLTVASTYGFDAEWLYDALDKAIAKDTVLSKIIANNDAWAGYQGYTVNAYITLNESGKLEVVAMVPDSRSSEELVIENARELIEVSAIDGSGNVSFEYLEDADAARAKKLEVDKSFKLYINNIEETNADAKKTAFESLKDGAFASVTLLDSDDDGNYDRIYLTNYVYGIVEEVDAELEIIETTRTSYYLSADDTSDAFVYTIYKDGEEIDLEDLAKGDLLNVVIGDLDNNVEDATFVDIYVTNNVIESSVSSKSGTGADARYVIDGEDYYLATGNLVTSMNPGDTGSFYITIDGYIYDADFTSTYSDNYAFILNIAKVDDGWGEGWEIRLLDKNNNVKTLPVKKTVYVTDTNDSLDYAKKPLKSDEAAYSEYFTKVANRVHVASADEADHNVKARFVTFKESNGEISELVFAKSSSDDKDFRVVDLPNAVDSEVKYSAKTGLLGGYEVADTTYIFSIPTANGALAKGDETVDYKIDADSGTDGYQPTYWMLDEDLIQVYAISNLDEDENYKGGYVFNVDKDGVAGAMILTNDPGFAGNVNALAVVRSKSEGLNAAGEMATVVTFWQGTESNSLVVAENGFVGTNIFEGDITPGDVFQYTVNADGEINGSKLIYDFSAKKLMVSSASGDITFAVGVVNDITAKRLTYSNASGDNQSLAWDELSTNVLVDAAKIAGTSSSAIRGYNSTSYIKGYTVKSVDWDGTGAGETKFDIFAGDVYVTVVKADDGAIVDVVTYKYSKDAIASANADGAYDTGVEDVDYTAAEFVDLFTIA